MKKQKNIFITGATGFLGSNILKLILEGSDSNIVINLLIRGKDQIEAKQRGDCLISKVLGHNFNNSQFNRIKIINGSIEKRNFGLENNEFSRLLENIDEIYHCAAVTGFRISLDEARKINVYGTKNIIDFSFRCKRLTKLNYISTTFIAGDREGLFTEEDFFVGQQFNNAYEQSKFEAEALFRECKKRKFFVSIFRPSVIIGNYFTGETSNFKMFYEPLHIFSLNLFKEVPANPKTLHNLIPVDICAKAIYILATNEHRDQTYHIVSHNNVECGHFYDSAAKFFRYKNPKFIPIENFNLKTLSQVQYKMISSYLPYFNYKTLYASEKTERILEKYNFKFPSINEEFYKRVFQYCANAGFVRIKKLSESIR